MVIIVIFRDNASARDEQLGNAASEHGDQMSGVGPETQPLQSSGRPCILLNINNIAGSQMRTRAMTRLRERERVDYSAL